MKKIAIIFIFILGCCLFSLTAPPSGLAYFAPEENPPWKNNHGSDLDKLLKAYDAPRDRVHISDNLSGYFQLAGMGYESDYIDEFAVGNDVLFSNQDSLNGLWSGSFDIEEAVLRINQDPFNEKSVQPTSSINKAYQLNSDWSYSPTGVLFQSGDYILGLGDGYGDFDYDDLVVGLRSASAPVPEPGTWAMLGFGLLGLLVIGRKRPHFIRSIG